MAKRCGSHGLSAAINIKKTKLHTQKPTSPRLLYDPHHSWNLIEAVEMPRIAQNAWLPLLQRGSTRNSQAWNPSPNTSHHGVDTLRLRQPEQRGNSLREYGQFPKHRGLPLWDPKARNTGKRKQKLVLYQHLPENKWNTSPAQPAELLRTKQYLERIVLTTSNAQAETQSIKYNE